LRSCGHRLRELPCYFYFEAVIKQKTMLYFSQSARLQHYYPADNRFLSTWYPLAI